MICLLCGNEIPKRLDGTVAEYNVYVPVQVDANNGEEKIPVCGRCYLLSCIHDKLADK